LKTNECWITFFKKKKKNVGLPAEVHLILGSIFFQKKYIYWGALKTNERWMLTAEVQLMVGENAQFSVDGNKLKIGRKKY
jgi:hypothetical protein